MKKLKNLPRKTRTIIGICAVAVGVALSFLVFGTYATGLFLILPFALFFVWLCPELWHGD